MPITVSVTLDDHRDVSYNFRRIHKKERHKKPDARYLNDVILSPYVERYTLCHREYIISTPPDVRGNVQTYQSYVSHPVLDLIQIRTLMPVRALPGPMWYPYLYKLLPTSTDSTSSARIFNDVCNVDVYLFRSTLLLE